MLDIGCGRGEFLGLMQEAGIPARGIDLDSASVEMCRTKGMSAEVADLFEYLERERQRRWRHFRRPDCRAPAAGDVAANDQALRRDSNPAAFWW